MEGISVTLMVMKSLGMLALVLGALIGTLHMMKKITPVGGKAGDKGMIRMLSAFYLTPKERIVLMEVMGRKILIGVTPQGITRITEFEASEWTEPEESPVQDNMFANLLSRITKQSNLAGKAAEKESPSM